MYNHTNLLTCLRGLIGFEQSYFTEHPDVDADLQQSSSGVFVNNSLHPLLTAENILSVAEQFSKVNVRAWNASPTYKKNDIVKSGAVVYQSIQDTNLNHVVTDADWWKATNLYSAYLRRLYDGSALKLIGTIFTQKKLNEVAKTLLGEVHLYEGVGNISGRITKQNRVVGFKIRVKHPDTVAILNYIGMQVDTIQNSLNIYLYHSSSNTPVKIFALNQTKSVQFQWHRIESEILSFMSDDINAAGHWYLCYYESELTGEAIRKEISFNGKNVCGTCDEAILNSNLHSRWSKFIAIQPFYVTSTYVNEDYSLWDEEHEMYVNDYNFGLNLQLSVQCDVTHVLCQGKSVLTDALSKQITVDLLNEMAYSLRDNQLKQKAAGMAAVALDNQENGQYGEAKRLAMAIKAVSFDLSNMSDVCMPCSSQGTRLKSVWS
jgi:hypothetical protein